jgi:hypothetical protein
MTRYSRSVIPGRSQGEEGGNRAGLDQMVFGSKKKPIHAPATDGDDPDFLPAVEDDEADLLVGRSNTDRRKGEDRRKPASERRAASRRSPEYAPLREQGGYRGADDNRRGPILLVGAVMIVAVFGVVVWNAYREDGAVPAEETQVLAGAGPFKRPFIDNTEPTAPTIAEQAEVLDALDGAPASSSVASSEQRPVPPPAAAAPIPSNPTAAPSPAPLKTPTQSEPVRAATAVTQPGPVALTPAPSTPRASAPQTVAPKPVAAAPAPAPAAVVSTTVKPAFTASGAWLVQIAATGSEASAISEWTRYSKASADLFAGAERVVQQADVNGKTVYRLRVGSFASKEDAAAFCSAFKAKGGNCYPAAK